MNSALRVRKAKHVEGLTPGGEPKIERHDDHTVGFAQGSEHHAVGGGGGGGGGSATPPGHVHVQLGSHQDASA
jgi:hypothetical protein